MNDKVQRSEQYKELRMILYKIFYYSYIKLRLELPEGTSKKRRKKLCKRMHQNLYVRIGSIIKKWEQLTLEECGEVYSIVGIMYKATIDAGIALKKKDHEYLRERMEMRLKELLPKQKRKRVSIPKYERVVPRSNNK